MVHSNYNFTTEQVTRIAAVVKNIVAIIPTSEIKFFGTVKRVIKWTHI